MHFVCKETPSRAETCNLLLHAGYTGHAWVWQQLAFEVERFAARLFGASLDLNRVSSAAIEYRQSNVLPGELYFWSFFTQNQYQAFLQMGPGGGNLVGESMIRELAPWLQVYGAT